MHSMYGWPGVGKGGIGGCYDERRVGGGMRDGYVIA